MLSEGHFRVAPGFFIAISPVKPSMLRQNPLQPPRPIAPAPKPAADRPSAGRIDPHLSAEDFDGTGILRGIDPCESRYWWMPELYEPVAAGLSSAPPPLG